MKTGHITEDDKVDKTLCGRSRLTLTYWWASNVPTVNRLQHVYKEKWCKTCAMLFNANHAKSEDERIPL